jgi:hypothetical protein
MTTSLAFTTAELRTTAAMGTVLLAPDLIFSASAFVDDRGAGIACFPASYLYYTVTVNGVELPKSMARLNLDTQHLTLEAAGYDSPNTPISVKFFLAG